MENEIRQLDSKFVMRYQIFESKNSKIYFGYQNQKNCTELTIKVLKQNNVDNTIFQSILQKIQKLPSSNAIKILFFGTGKISTKKKKSVNKFFFVEEKASKGEFFDYIMGPHKGFTEQISKIFFYQILNGLKSYHDLGLVCSPLKFSNILLDSHYRIKISDFVSENLLNETKENKKKQGNSNHIELASMLFAMVTGRNPIIKGRLFSKKKMPYFWDSARELSSLQFSEDFIDIINKLFLNESFEQYKTESNTNNNFYVNIMNHPWLKGVNQEMIDSGAGTTPFYEKIINEFEIREECLNDSRKEDIRNFFNLKFQNERNANNEKVYRSKTEIEEDQIFLIS